jgi:hypothetical protein
MLDRYADVPAPLHKSSPLMGEDLGGGDTIEHYRKMSDHPPLDPLLSEA